jgi:stearoyl-CoA desaturase (delta-9 desaturase)
MNTFMRAEGEMSGQHTENEVPRIVVTPGVTDPVEGRVRWDPIKTAWIVGMGGAGVLGAWFTFSWPAFAVFVVLTSVTLCCGHSVGLHRCVIHKSFSCPLWLERFLAYLGTLVGLGGPLGMARLHDTRDWAQRQPDCHPYLRHGQPLLVDAWWQLCCRLELTRPPRFAPEPRLADDPVYRFLERTWMGQQLPVALLLFAWLGWGGVVWGVCLRVAVGVVGHWFVNHLAHNGGRRPWRIDGVGVEGYNVPAALSVLSFGEGWHNNHHAFPRSARHGHTAAQPDPGWWFIRALGALGLARDVLLPGSLPPRPGRRPAG